MSLPTLRANAHRPERSHVPPDVRITVFNTPRLGNRRWPRGGFRRLPAGDTGDPMKRSFFHLPVMAILAFHLAPLSPLQPPTHIEPTIHRPAMAPVPSPAMAVDASVTAERLEPTPTPTPAPIVVSRPPSGSHTDWMAAAGIAESDWVYVEYIISHESSWNPNAVNRSSGACGLGQQLPCGKWPHTWNDPVGGLIDASAYAHSRYGSWSAAYSAWKRQGWW